MSNPALNQPGTAAPSDGESRDPVTDALKTIEQTHAALMKVRAQVEDATRLLSEFARISAVFDSVGDRLVNATFKASGEATRGVPSHTVLVAFVEELGDLARLSLGGARDVRRELRARSNQTDAVGGDASGRRCGAEGAGEHAAPDLAAAVARIVPTPSPIEIENRTVPPPPPRVPSALERALAGGVFASTGPKAGGYKN